MRRRLRSKVLGILVSVAVSVAIAAWPGRSTFTVSTETTYITEPLDKHGYVDYVTALNQRIGKGITPANNANVLIWQAIGPPPEGVTMPSEYFQWLGIECPPAEGEYWISWLAYLKQHAKKDADLDRHPDANRADRPLDPPYTPSRAKDPPELAAWLEQNKRALTVILEATGRPDYYNPLVPSRTEDWSPGLPAAPLPGVSICREIASALVWRAMLSIAEGKVDEAWQDLLACHRLGRLIGRGACLVEFLVGFAIDRVATRGDVAFLSHAKLTSRQAMDCLDDLRQLPPLPAAADEVVSNERFMLLDTIMQTARHVTAYLEDLTSASRKAPEGNQFGAKLFTRSINWDPAFRNSNRRYDQYVAALRIADRSERVQELSAITQDVKILGDQAIFTPWPHKQFMGPEGRGEIIGNILIRLFMPALDKFESLPERGEQEQRNLHVAFALAAYHANHGGYPAKLDELVPKYLEKVPDDLFSGEALIYRLEDDGYLLYSVGVNGIDEDGRGDDDQPRGDDLSIRMPVPAPQANR